MENIMKNKRYTVKEIQIKKHKFYQTPKFLFADEYRQCSNNTRVLYSLLRDRLDLSLANGWANKDGEVYIIYTRESLAKELTVSIPTVKKSMDQLKALNLIEEERRGLSKPNLIYILFADIDTYIPPEYLKKEGNNGKYSHEENVIKDYTGNIAEEVFCEENIMSEKIITNENKKFTEDPYSPQTERFFHSVDKDSFGQKNQNLCPNQTDLKKTNFKETSNLSYLSIDSTTKNNNIKTILKKVVKELLQEVIEEAVQEVAEETKNKNSNTNFQTESTNQSTTEEHKQTTAETTYETTKNTKTNRKQKKKKRKARQQKNNTSDAPTAEEYNEYREIISQNIEYETIKGDSEIIQGLFETLVDTVTLKTPTIRVSGVNRPAEAVKSRLLKLNAGHIQYVVECLKNCKSDIHNISSYMLTSLYNSLSSIDAYYTTKVNHDLSNDTCSSCNDLP